MEAPYNNCRPNDGMSKRISVDIPIAVYERIRSTAPKASRWKILLQSFIAQLDRHVQEGIDEAPYPACQTALFLCAEELTKKNIHVPSILDKALTIHQPK